MVSRTLLEARVKQLEEKIHPLGRVFVINVRDGEENGPRAKALEDGIRKEHRLYKNRRDVLIKIRNFTSDESDFARIADEILIHKMSS